MLLSLTALQTALEVGAIYSLVALALFISFSILNIATPYGRTMVALQKQKLAAKKKREGAKIC